MASNKISTVLVTGSNGFLGKSVVRLLKKKGYRVAEFSKSNGNDITKFDEVNKACKGADAIVHLAAIINEAVPLNEMKRVNVDGTRNALEAAAKNKVKRFIHCSSISVYGEFDGLAREDQPFNPKNKYDQTKVESEQLVMEYQEVLPVTVIRPPLIVGANEYWRSAIKQAKKGFPIVGNGDNAMPVMHVEDVADAFVFCLEHEETIGEIYNVSSKQGITQSGVRKAIAQELGLSQRFSHAPLWLARLGAVALFYWGKMAGKKSIVNPSNVRRITQNRNLDSSKLRSLGWSPHFTGAQAIEKTVKELKQQNKI